MLMLDRLTFFNQVKMFSPRCSRASALAFVFVVFGIAGASAGALSRIIGGSDAKPGEFPWQVSIRAYDTHLCGGTIIGKRHILTAGHCIDGITEAPYSEMTVVTGSNTLEPGTGKAFRVKDVAIHKKYVARTSTRAVQNDIAVISLRKEIEENEFQRPIALPTSEVPDGVQATVSGFGRTISDGRVSPVLKKLDVTLLGSAKCFDNGLRIQKYQVCGVKSSGYGTCKGDSGGPLVYNGAIVGVVSTSRVPCGSGIPDAYTRVFYFKDFIENAMANI